MTAPPIVHWFRRDLRLHDNTALSVALESGAPVIPLFIFDPAILRSRRVGAPRVAFMLKTLAALDTALRERGSALVVRHGNPLHVLPAFVEQTGALAVTFNRDYTPFARRRDAAIQQALVVPAHCCDDALLVAPGDLLKADSTPYTVFTPFKRAWDTTPKALPLPTTRGVFHPLEGIANPGLPALSALGFSAAIEVPEGGEGPARQRLEAFTSDTIYEYDTGRNRLAADPQHSPAAGSSFLSPHLRFGALSTRESYRAAQAALDAAPDARARKAVETWVGELAWREFYMHILYHFPHVTTRSFRPEYDALAWRDAPTELQAWKDGLTGYPVVDAAMRQLAQTGWLPNRARMIVASFLAKDLLIDWRAGELHFMQRLIDGDLAANNGGWQWTAGTGTDAQPYFRVFNPVTQSSKFDPRGEYIRRWVPELRAVPDAHIHAPWEMDSPPRGYPPPMVDHRFARERALAAYGAARTSPPQLKGGSTR